MTTDFFNPKTATKDELTNERARRSVQAFRAMQAGLTGYARAITGNKLVTVEVSKDSARTDGKKIYYKPPIELGDLKPHKRSLCDKRDPETLRQRCDACRVRETVLIAIYHEIAHIAFETFAEPSNHQKIKAVERAIEEAGTKHAAAIKAQWDQIPSFKKGDYLNLSSLISPFLPVLINALEDARVDESMFKARRGTKVMFDAFTLNIFREGVEEADGTRTQWSDRPLNSQAILGIFVLACRYKYEGWFSPEVEQALGDKKLGELVARVDTLRSAEGSYNLAFPILQRLRELGFCRGPEDAEDEVQEPEPEPQENPQEEEQQDEQEDQDDDSDSAEDESSPGEDGTEGEQGSPEDADEGEPSDGGDSAGDEGDDGAPSEPGDDGDERDAGDSDSDDADSDEAAGEDSSGSGGGASDQADEGEGEGGSEPSEDPSDGAGDDEHEVPDQGDAADGDEGPDGGAEGSADSGGSEGTPNSDADGDSEEVEGEEWDDEDGASDDDGDPSTEEGAPSDGSGSEGDGDEGELVGPEDQAGHDEADGGSEQGGDVLGEPDPSNTAPTDLGELDDGTADKGEGGTKVNKVNYLDMGTADEALEDVHVFGQHERPELPKTIDEITEMEAVERAVLQSEYFEKPSTNINGVREHKYLTRDESASAWEIDEYMEEYYKRQGIVTDLDIPESVLGPALLEMRRTFSDNQRSNMERHLRSGKINQRVLGKRAWAGDDRLFQKKRIPGRKSYAVLLGIDASGSTMGQNIALAKRAAMAQAELCNRAGIDFAVYAHSANSDPGAGYARGLSLDIYEIKSFEAAWDTNSKSALEDLGADCENLDGHTIEYYRKMIERHPATDKIILYYSDGKMPAANHDEELEILQREITYCKRKAITLMGVGIRTDSPRRHGLNTVRVDSDSDVNEVVRHLESALLHRR